MPSRHLFAAGLVLSLRMIACEGDTFLSTAGAAAGSGGTQPIAGAGGAAGEGGAGGGATAGEAGTAGAGGLAGAAGSAGSAGAAGDAGAAGEAGSAGTAGAAGSGGVAGARSCEAVAECAEPTVNCQIAACVDGLCTTTPLDAVPCGANQVCQQGICICACAKGAVEGMPGCLAPDLVLDPPEANLVVDGKRDVAFRPTAQGKGSLTLSASFPEPVLLAGLTLDISATGAGGKPRFGARYEVFAFDPDGARVQVGSLEIVRDNGDHLLVDIPVVSGSYVAVELRISTPTTLPADADFTDVAIYELTAKLCP